jgi:hypothetical protein
VRYRKTSAPIPVSVKLVFPARFVVVQRVDYQLVTQWYTEEIWLKVHEAEPGSDDRVLCYEADYPGREHDLFLTRILEDTPDVLRAIDYRFGEVTVRRRAEPRGKRVNNYVDSDTKSRL